MFVRIAYLIGVLLRKLPEERLMLPWIVFIAAVVLAATLSGRYTAKYAVQRGRSKRTWFFLGALLFPLFPVPVSYTHLTLPTIYSV